jgi:hypothetical protein
MRKAHGKNNFFAAGFDPEAYGTLLGWWQADDSVLVGGNLVSVPNIAAVPGYGSMVAYLTAPLPTYSANAWNGGPGLVSSGGSSQRLYSTLIAAPPSDWAVALVASQSAPSGSLRYWLGMAGNSGYGDYTITASPNVAGSNPSAFNQNFGPQLAGQQVIVLTKTSNVLEFWRDGVSLGTISGADPTASSIAYLMMLSAVNQNAAQDGTWKAALAYSGTLSVTPTDLSDALATEYGV